MQSGQRRLYYFEVFVCLIGQYQHEDLYHKTSAEFFFIFAVQSRTNYSIYLRKIFLQLIVPMDIWEMIFLQNILEQYQ